MAGGAKTVPRLTDTIIRATTKTVWDSDLRGFGVRVSGNTKTFIVLIASGRRQKIGRYPLVSLGKARDEAKRILAEKELGNVKPTFIAYADAKDAYLRDCEARNKASTVFGYRWRLDTALNFDRKNLADITPRDITEKLAALDHAPQEKRYAFVVARAFFNWCVKHYYLDSSPIGRLPAPAKGKPRERTLHPSELKAIYQACENDPFGASVRLLVLTGQRRGEIAYLTHENAVASILGTHTKNGRAHSFPITTRIAELLSHDRTFNGWGKAKARLDKVSGVTGWTLHDLRRTYATVLAELGTAPHVIEKLLNHASGQISGVAAVYNKFQYLDEMRKAVDAFETWFRGLLDDPCL